MFDRIEKGGVAISWQRDMASNYPKTAVTARIIKAFKAAYTFCLAGKKIVPDRRAR